MNTIESKSFGKTILAALIGSGITLGAYSAFDKNERVIIEKAPENYSRVASVVTSTLGNAVHPDFSAAAELVTPAVVHIRSNMRREAVSRREMPSPFRDFFGDDSFGEGFRFDGPQQPAQSSGSGVIISADGYIVTNNHVVENADEIEVSLYDKRTYKAKVIGTDPSTDMALLKVEEKGLPKLVIGNSDNVKVGQWVLAVGNPFNLESTVTAGIVSAKGRSINILQDKFPIESFIQTDAAVNPGNSGGALVNLNGELIGINTAIATPNGTFAGYSFAVPSNLTTKVVEDLIKFGTVQRAFLGITIRDVNGKLAEEKNLNVYDGVYVDSLVTDGAARAAGIKAGDVITTIDGRKVGSVAELQETIARHRPGDEISVVVNRKGTPTTIKVPLRNGKGTMAIVKNEKPEVVKSLGAEFEDVSANEQKKLGIKGGVRVSKLAAGKLSSETEIKEGFIITKANQKPIQSKSQLLKVLESEGDEGVLLEGVYPGSTRKYYYGFGM